MKVVYIRVSTANQNVERQMRKEGKKAYIDICSGTVPFAERAEGKKIIELSKLGKIEDVQVASIDRLGRNLGDILKTVEFLTTQQVNIYIEDQGINTMIEGKPNPTAKLIIDIMASVYEFERKNIKERTQQGIEIAKSKGKYNGRPRGAKNKRMEYRHKEKIAVIQSALDRGQSILSICKEYGYNRGLIYRLIDRNLINKNTEAMSE